VFSEAAQNIIYIYQSRIKTSVISHWLRSVTNCDNCSCGGDEIAAAVGACVGGVIREARLALPSIQCGMTPVVGALWKYICTHVSRTTDRMTDSACERHHNGTTHVELVR